MGVPLIFAAIILFAAAIQNQLPYLATNLETDLRGFTKWLLAIAAIGAIGLIPGQQSKRISNALLALVIIVILLKNPNIFTNIKSGSAFSAVAPPSNAGPATAPAQQSQAAPGVTVSGTVTQPTTQTLATGGGANLVSQAAKLSGNVIAFPGLDLGSLGTGLSSGSFTGGL